MEIIRKIIEIDEEKCDGLDADLGDCPKGALKLIERRADEYDEQAVHARLDAQKSTTAPLPQPK